MVGRNFLQGNAILFGQIEALEIGNDAQHRNAGLFFQKLQAGRQ